MKDVAKADAFYKDILGFRLQWKGGPRDDAFQWISMMVPDGYDWLEYMVRPEKLTVQQLGVMHHYCLETKDIQKLHQDVVARGYTPQNPPAVHARDGRWLMQMFDKNLTRTEVMVRKAAQKPCCSPNYDDHPEVARAAPSTRRGPTGRRRRNPAPSALPALTARPRSTSRTRSRRPSRTVSGGVRVIRAVSSTLRRAS